MRVPACWLEEVGYPNGRFPSYCSNRQSNKSTHRQRECGWSQLFFHFIRPATRYANKNQHCAKEEKKKGLKKKENYWKRFIFERCLGLSFENSIRFIKNVFSLDHKALYPLFKGNCCALLILISLHNPIEVTVKDQMMQYAKAPCRENSW